LGAATPGLAFHPEPDGDPVISGSWVRPKAISRLSDVFFRLNLNLSKKNPEGSNEENH
jgi:hypothetical protein